MQIRPFIWRATVFLPPVTKKNSQRIIINSRTKRPMILPSAKYENYEKEAKKFIRPPDEPISTPVNVRCIYYMPTNRPCDLTNLMEATHDLLVKTKVIADDNSKVIYAVDGSRVYHDKLTPRTEIFIEEYSE